ncbi:MAG: YbhB/YbcL family Raf kinase inhibitor-like protein [Actinomycetes bacterium]
MSEIPSSPQRQRCRRSVLAVLAIVLVSLTVAACGTSGRTLQDPKPGATAPARKNSGSTAPPNTAAGGTNPGPQINATGLALQTTAWRSGQAIPKPYTCDGVNTSPSFTITGVPAGTVELVLVASNQNVASQTLWLLAGISPSTPSLPQGGVPTGAIQITNSSGTPRWSGPCPASGTNTYEFALYALSAPSGLTTSATLSDVDAAISKSTTASVITGTYSR